MCPALVSIWRSVTQTQLLYFLLFCYIFASKHVACCVRVVKLYRKTLEILSEGRDMGENNLTEAKRIIKLRKLCQYENAGKSFHYFLNLREE